MLRTVGRSAIIAALLLACAIPAARAVTVTAHTHVQVVRNGSTVDHFDGDVFDATNDEIAQLLPTGAISIGTGTVVGGLSDAASTQQVLSGLSVLASRPAEPNSLGWWFAQNQCSSPMYLAFYSGSSAVTDPGAARLATIAIDPGAGIGRQGADQSWQTSFGPFKGPITLWGVSGCQATLPRQ